MLIQANPSYRQIVYYMSVEYRMKQYHQHFQPESVRGELLQQGYFTPKIVYSFEPLTAMIEQQEYTLEAGQAADTVSFITSKLDEGYCLFASVDRFYYPSGREAQRFHLVHPVFIYGYDETRGCFLTIEDCILPGQMEYYELPYHSFYASCDHFHGLGQNITVTICRVKQPLTGLGEREVMVAEARKMCTGLLDQGVFYEEQYDLYYHMGLDSLDAFLKEMDVFCANTEELSLYKIRMLQFQQLHLRNIHLVRYLVEQGELASSTAEPLLNQYTKLHDEWNRYRQKSFIFFAAKKVSGVADQVKLQRLKEQLSELRDMEREAAVSFLMLLDPTYV